MGKQLRDWRLPDGSFTNSVIEHVRAWKQFGRPIAKATNCPIGGFGGGIDYQYVKMRGNNKLGLYGQVQLPMWFIIKLNRGIARFVEKITQLEVKNAKLLKENKKLRRQLEQQATL